MNNYIIYDYVSFTSKIHSPDNLIVLLGLQDVKFETLKGFYGYKDRLYYDGISIHFNGRDDMGVCVEMSGHGCRAFEDLGNADYDSLFSLILSHYSDNADNREMNLTRLDVAYDDFTGVLDLPLLCRETQQLHFVSRFKDWQVISGNKGIAVNHGSNKSNVYIRCYDKRLEQNAQNILDHWVRFEIQIRRECAIGFIQLQDDITHKYFLTLNNYLRYVVPSGIESNSSMLDTAPYWLDFIEYYDSAPIFHKPGSNYDFNKLYAFVNHQVSGAVSTYIEYVGVDQFLLDIHNARKGKVLNEKYKNLIDQTYEENGSQLLLYLQEHNLL